MRRNNARQRGYDAQWERAAAEFRDHNPLCIGCRAIGVITEASIVDHVIPHQGDKTLFWAQENWQAACEWHHNAIKPMLEREWRAGKIFDIALRLDSNRAVQLTRARYKRPVGLDGFAIE